MSMQVFPPTRAKSLAELARSLLKILVVARVLGWIPGGVTVGTAVIVDAGGLVEYLAAAVGVEIEMLRTLARAATSP